MKIYIAIDDTRCLDGGGAGKMTASLSGVITDNKWGSCQMTSRHRLYPNPVTGCKKHNTARCFPACIDEDYLPVFIEYACKIIKTSAAPGSNAGLAIVIPALLEDVDALREYSYKVKEDLVDKEQTLAMGRNPGIFLFELSGNGNGIIGALAAAGLRSTGNDGQIRGQLKIGSGEGSIVTVQEILDNTYVKQVKSMTFETLVPDETIRLGEKVKVVVLDHQYTLMVFPAEREYPKWQTSTTNMLRGF